MILAALALFLTRRDVGVAVRAAAESPDRALLLGIPVRRLSLLAWTLAAGLSGVGALLSAPVLGPQIGVASGPLVLMAPLVAAVIARMESLPVAYAAGVGLGITQQWIFWNYPRSSTVDVAFFGVVLVAMLTQRKRLSRHDDGGGASASARRWNLPAGCRAAGRRRAACCKSTSTRSAGNPRSGAYATTDGRAALPVARKYSGSYPRRRRRPLQKSHC